MENPSNIETAIPTAEQPVTESGTGSAVTAPTSSNPPEASDPVNHTSQNNLQVQENVTPVNDIGQGISNQTATNLTSEVPLMESSDPSDIQARQEKLGLVNKTVEPPKPLKLYRKRLEYEQNHVEKVEIHPTTVSLFQLPAINEAEIIKPAETDIFGIPQIPLVYAFVPLPNIISDINTRGILSDFSSVFKKILDSKADEILVCHEGLVEGKNIYEIFVNAAAVKLFCASYGLEMFEPKKETIESKKGWLNLGSDKDIDEEKLKKTRNQIRLMISRPRREFGKPYQFQDRESAEAYNEFKPLHGDSEDLFRIQKNVGIQAIPSIADNCTQTNWFRSVNFSCQYEPQEFSEKVKSAKVVDPYLKGFLKDAVRKVELAITQNIIFDVYRNEFVHLGDDDMGLEQGAQAMLQENQSFTDLKHSKDRSISCIDWHPSQKGIIAVSCVQRCTLDEKIDMGWHAKSKNSILLLWNFSDPIHPQLLLEGPDEIQTFGFNPTNSNCLIAGCANGQIVAWDLSEYKDRLRMNKKQQKDTQQQQQQQQQQTTVRDIVVVHHAAASSIEFSHRGPVTDLTWIPKELEILNNGDIIDTPSNQEHYQFVSVSLDGQVFFWDLRFRKELRALDLVWRPFIKVPLSSMDNTFDYGCTKVSLAFRGPSMMNVKGGTPNHLDYLISEKSQLSKFFCGTEEGDLLLSDWVAEKTEEKASRVEHFWSNHFGNITDLQRNPAFIDLIMSIGSWNFHIWKEGEMSAPLMSSHVYTVYLTAGCWSPTRAAVFFLTKADGSIEAWDLLDRTHEPTLVQKISTSALTYLKIHAYGHQQLLAVGDDNGTLHVLMIPRILSKPRKNEKGQVKSYFEREIKRNIADKERKVLGSNAKNQQAEIQTETKTDGVAQGKAEQSNGAEAEEAAWETKYGQLEKDFLDRLEVLTSS